MRGSRERYELGDMILLRQHDLKRTVQISRASNTYLIAPDAAVEAAPAADMSIPKPPGVVNVETSIADVGERKDDVRATGAPRDHGDRPQASGGLV